MACPHVNKVKINDVTVCTKCGLTFLPGGKVVFDRRLANIGNTTKRRRIHRAKT